MFSEKLIAFCIAGHCDNSAKLKQAVDIIQIIKEKYPNELISYCSHIPVDPSCDEGIGVEHILLPPLCPSTPPDGLPQVS